MFKYMKPTMHCNCTVKSNITTFGVKLAGFSYITNKNIVV